MSHKRGLILAATAAGLVLLGACGSSDNAAVSSTTAPSSTSTASSTTSSSSAMESSSSMGESTLVGAGCAGYAEAVPTGAGSVEGMAADPVATAASNNPLLTTLVAAVSGGINPEVDLVSTLNGAEFTVFAPVDEAFAADVDAATLEVLKTDAELLTSILTYHVIPGQIAPDAIEGTHTTVQGEDLEVTGSGDTIEVNGNAMVICGGVKTSNATVYLIDHVLMPPSLTAPAEGTATESAAMGAATLVGPGCAAYAEAVPSGAGSVDGMAADPVATAASNNPLLSTLVKAVSGQVNPGVNLVSTLNGAEFTVFAPVDEAFAEIDAATMTTLTTDAALLTSILTYHVVSGQIAPDAIVGTHTTVQGQDLTVEGAGDSLTVNGDAAVICGGVKTANATVYLIDTVLTPPAS